MLKIYVVYDVYARCATRILNFENDEIAIRFLESAFKVPNSPFALNVKESKLFHIADYDDDLRVVPVAKSTEVSYVQLDGETTYYTVQGRCVKAYDDLVNRFLEAKKSNEKRSETYKE